MSQPRNCRIISIELEFGRKPWSIRRRAGKQAQALYAPREAIAHFTAHSTPRGNLASPCHARMCAIGRRRTKCSGTSITPGDNAIALELAHQSAQRADEWQSLVDLGFLWQSRDLVQHAGGYFERAYDLARQLENNTLIAQSLTHIGHWHVHGGQLREGLADHQQALELFQELNDRRGMAQTLELLGLDSYVLGEVLQGVAYCEQAVPIQRELDDRQGLTNTLTTLCMRLRFDTEVMGEIDVVQLARLSETALEIARSCDYRVGEAGAFARGCSLPLSSRRIWARLGVSSPWAKYCGRDRTSGITRQRASRFGKRIIPGAVGFW